MLLRGDAPGAATVSGDMDVVGVSLGDSCRDRADAELRDQFDADGRARIDALQIVNQLRQVLDAVDIVMRRRTNERDSRLRVAQPGDEFGNLVAGELPALARLRALSNLDLQLLGVRQIFGGHAEAS